MHRRLVVLAVGCGMLNGCVAVVAPIVAAGALGGKQVIGRKGGRPDAPPQEPTSAPVPVRPLRVTAAPAPTQKAAPTTAAAAAPPAAPEVLPTHGWRAMVTYVADLVQASTRPAAGAVPVSAAMGTATRFLPCGTKPYAVIIDAEGTVLAPIGSASNTTVRTDEAVRAFGDLRFGQVTVIFTSGRPAAETAATEKALEAARLGPAMQGRELLSAADGPAGTTKATLRTAIARQYCVLALVGDEPDDFFDGGSLDGQTASGIALWGAGWFRVPAQSATP
jgi:hypothetical protein